MAKPGVKVKKPGVYIGSPGVQVSEPAARPSKLRPPPDEPPRIQYPTFKQQEDALRSYLIRGKIAEMGYLGPGVVAEDMAIKATHAQDPQRPIGTYDEEFAKTLMYLDDANARGGPNVGALLPVVDKPVGTYAASQPDPWAGDPYARAAAIARARKFIEATPDLAGDRALMMARVFAADPTNEPNRNDVAAAAKMDELTRSGNEDSGARASLRARVGDPGAWQTHRLQFGKMAPAFNPALFDVLPTPQPPRSERANPGNFLERMLLRQKEDEDANRMTASKKQGPRG